jgi:2-polyprenyl-3-methyl-5-hydroxy-6-metoxy-1,4-benzoquinol methylase
MEISEFSNFEVLEFYKTLPFNLKGSVEGSVETIRKSNPDRLYPGISNFLGPDAFVLEVGCGVGWLSNSISYLYNSSVVGIDFNPLAIESAQNVARMLNLNTKFIVEDLFLYTPDSLFDVVISSGVLHHTNDCERGIRRCCEAFIRPGGHVVIGLYHSYGRQPFLDYFAKMKKEASEKEMFQKYRLMHKSIQDETQLYSWFRDQVLNPHETQHTLKEMLPILESSGMELIGTSINNFQSIHSLDHLLEEEKKYRDIAMQRLCENRYFPGFFVFIARKRS